MPHVRIERADSEGKKRITLYDRLVVVDDDGSEIDISTMTRGWNLSAKVNEAEALTLYLLGARIIENPDLLPSPKE